jgi:Fe-Mn family superoxide dismutase
MYNLPKLEYGYDAFGTYFSPKIMELHHSKHHQIYVDKLNAALKDHPELLALPVDQLLRQVAALPAELQKPVRNFGGGHYNHSLFWQWLSPDGGGEPQGALGEALLAKYGSFQAFMDQYSAASLGVFGSGWSWLMPDLSIATSPNQDTPVTEGGAEPILGLDVWEHAYYVDFTYNRADYVQAWWHVANWKHAEEAYLKGQKN